MQKKKEDERRLSYVKNEVIKWVKRRLRRLKTRREEKEKQKRSRVTSISGYIVRPPFNRSQINLLTEYLTNSVKLIEILTMNAEITSGVLSLV